jgi:hypothetical protein
MRELNRQIVESWIPDLRRSDIHRTLAELDGEIEKHRRAIEELRFAKAGVRRWLLIPVVWAERKGLPPTKPPAITDTTPKETCNLCSAPVQARGLCMKHYKRDQRARKKQAVLRARAIAKRASAPSVPTREDAE